MSEWPLLLPEGPKEEDDSRGLREASTAATHTRHRREEKGRIRTEPGANYLVVSSCAIFLLSRFLP